MRTEACTTDTVTWILSKRELNAFLGVASKDLARGNLSQIAFDAKGGAVVATDGHRLTVATTTAPKTDCEDVRTISREDAAAAAKLASMTDEIRLTFADKTVTVAVRDRFEALKTSISFDSKGAYTFPPYLQVISEPTRSTEPLQAIGLNPAYMKAIVEIGAATGGNAVRLSVFGELEPVHFAATGEDDSEWLHVIMPMRI